MDKDLGPRLSTRKAAEAMGVCKQRIDAKVLNGHFRGVSKCECGLTTMIPESEIVREIMKGKRPPS